MGFANLRTVIDEVEAGNSSYFNFRKVPSVGTNANTWFDYSMAQGNPIPNYYASSPLVSATLNGNEGLYYGGNVFPKIRHLKTITICSTVSTSVPMHLNLLDYLLYYPFIDQGTSDIQSMINSTPLPRYTDGEGVRMMAVLVAPQSTGGATFRVYYKNQNNISQVTPIIACQNLAYNGGILTSGATATNLHGPYLPLAPGDRGVRSVEAVEFITNDVGLISLVLVKPIAETYINEITAFSEKDYIKDSFVIPRIYDGAYLNFIGNSAGSIFNSTIIGDIQTIWR